MKAGTDPGPFPGDEPATPFPEPAVAAKERQRKHGGTAPGRKKNTSPKSGWSDRDGEAARQAAKAVSGNGHEPGVPHTGRTAILDENIPQNLAAERAVLGAVLLKNSLLLEVQRIVTVTDFYMDRHRRIYRAMVDLAERGAAVDGITLPAELARQGSLEAAGGTSYIAALTDGVPVSANVDHYAKIVKEKAILRSVIEASRKAASAAMRGEEPTGDIIADARRRLEAIQEDTVEGLDYVDLRATPPNERYLVRGAVPVAGRALMNAVSEGGKTFLAMDLSCAVATGDPWLGLEEFSITENRGPVIFVEEDATIAGMHNRLAKLARGRGLDLEDFQDRILLAVQRGVVEGSAAWRALVADVQRLGASLVVLDAAVRIMRGNENDALDVAAFWRACSEIQRAGAAVLVLHHVGHHERDRGRGSADWRAGADVEINLGSTDDRNRKLLKWTKVRDGLYPSPLYLNYDIEDDAARITSGGSQLRGRDRDEAVLEFIESGNERCQSRLAIQRHFYGNVSVRSFDRSIDNLKKAGRIRAKLDGYEMAT